MEHVHRHLGSTSVERQTPLKPADLGPSFRGLEVIARRPSPRPSATDRERGNRVPLTLQSLRICDIAESHHRFPRPFTIEHGANHCRRCLLLSPGHAISLHPRWAHLNDMQRGVLYAYITIVILRCRLSSGYSTQVTSRNNHVPRALASTGR